jgi:hypothetical protein
MLSTAFGYGRPARLAARFAFAFCRRDSGLASRFGRGRFQIGFRVRLMGFMMSFRSPNDAAGWCEPDGHGFGVVPSDLLRTRADVR